MEKRGHEDKRRDDEPRVYTFSAKLVKAEAMVAADPIFSRQALEKIGKDDKNKCKKGSTQKTTSNATVTNGTQFHPCIVCNKMHDFDECKNYLKKSLSDRRALIFEKGLCYACYGAGHRSRGCIQRRSCKIWFGRHPTGLHDENFRLRNRDSTDTSENAVNARQDWWQ